MIYVLSIIRFKRWKDLMQFKEEGLCWLAGLLAPVVLLSMTSICLAQGNTWTEKAEMEIPKHSHSTCVVNGKIYAMGGENFGSGCFAPSSPFVEEYDPSTDTWSIKTDMPTARESLSISAVIGGKIYAMGGSLFTCSGQLSTVEEYDPLTDTWAAKTNMQVPRTGLSTSVVNGKIYAIGGYNYSFDRAVADVEEYNPRNDTWITKTDMLTARAWLSTCVVDGKIYAFGGFTAFSTLKAVEIYDPVTDTWSTKNDMPNRLGAFTLSIVNGLIYICGGSTIDGEPVSDVWEYNPISDTWLLISQMPSARAVAHSSELNGKIYVIGGSEQAWPLLQASTTVQVYTPPEATGVEDQGENNPAEFALHQNYPNPFNPTTTIQYQMPERSEVRLIIFNLLGQRVTTLVDEVQSMGIYSIQWDGKDNSGQQVASGVYMYKLEAGQGFVKTRKMILLR